MGKRVDFSARTVITADPGPVLLEAFAHPDPAAHAAPDTDSNVPADSDTNAGTIINP